MRRTVTARAAPRATASIPSAITASPMDCVERPSPAFPVGAGRGGCTILGGTPNVWVGGAPTGGWPPMVNGGCGVPGVAGGTEVVGGGVTSMTGRPGVGEGVGFVPGVATGVGVPTVLTIAVGVAVGVDVGVPVGVAVGVAVGVGLGIVLTIAVGVAVGVEVEPGVPVGVGVPPWNVFVIVQVCDWSSTSVTAPLALHAPENVAV